jgi:peptidoglycan/LPS O-acetylase OafA/YrhL
LSTNKTDKVLGLVTSLGLIQQYHPVTDGRGNDVGWTLGVEAFVYLLFPLLVYVARGRWRRMTILVVASSILALGLGVLNVGNFYGSHRFTPSRIAEFALGMLGAYYFLSGGLRELVARRPAVAASMALGAAVSILAAPLLLQSRFDLAHLVYGPLAGILVCSIAGLDSIGRPIAFLSAPLVLLGGEISYSFYLLHSLVLRYIVRGPPRLGFADLAHGNYGVRILVAALALAVTIIASWALFRFFETPSRVWIRRRLSGAPNPVDAPTVANGKRVTDAVG